MFLAADKINFFIAAVMKFSQQYLMVEKEKLNAKLMKLMLFETFKNGSERQNEMIFILSFEGTFCKCNLGGNFHMHHKVCNSTPNRTLVPERNMIV